MTPEEATSILAHRFSSPTVGITDECVEALHVIIADVIDSAELAITSHLRDDMFIAPWKAENAGRYVTATVNSYVANHYGDEEFGL